MPKGIGTVSHLLSPSPDSVVYMADLANLVTDLERAGSKEAETIANEVIQAMGVNVEHLAKKYAPMKTGELRGSIGREEGFLQSRVYASAKHAFFVEFGTWSHSEIAPKSGTYEIKPVRAKALKFEVNGQTVFAKSVRHPGIKPQPFMRRALQETLDEFADTLGNVGVLLLMGDQL